MAKALQSPACCERGQPSRVTVNVLDVVRRILQRERLAFSLVVKTSSSAFPPGRDAAASGLPPTVSAVLKHTALSETAGRYLPARSSTPALSAGRTPPAIWRLQGRTWGGFFRVRRLAPSKGSSHARRWRRSTTAYSRLSGSHRRSDVSRDNATERRPVTAAFGHRPSACCTLRLVTT